MPSKIQASNLDLDPGPQRHLKATKLCHSGSPFSWVSKITYFHFTNKKAAPRISWMYVGNDHLTMATSKEPVPFFILKFFHVKSWDLFFFSGDVPYIQKGASFVSRHSTSGFISRQVGMRVLFGGCCAHSPRDDGDGLMWFL